MRYDSMSDYVGCQTNLTRSANIKGEFIEITHILKFGNMKIEISVEERDRIIQDLTEARDRLSNPDSNLSKNLRADGFTVNFEDRKGRYYRA